MDSPDLKQGRVLFMAHCQKCHPMGEPGLGLAINSSPAPKFVMRYQVRNGLGVMPSFPEDEITDQELDHLLNYIEALKENKD